jgi:hypothetical protein
MQWMTFMIELISKKIREEQHYHKCPVCKLVKLESNHVCGLSSGAHVFACVTCMQDVRLRLGTDILIDTYLDAMQAKRFQELAPDQHSVELDERDKDRAATINKLADQGLGPLKRAKPVELHPEQVKQIKKEQTEHLMDTATRMTQDEAMAELEKIEKKEKF